MRENERAIVERMSNVEEREREDKLWSERIQWRVRELA
jgi:hypothetical protein